MEAKVVFELVETDYHHCRHYCFFPMASQWRAPQPRWSPEEVWYNNRSISWCFSGAFVLSANAQFQCAQTIELLPHGSQYHPIAHLDVAPKPSCQGILGATPWDSSPTLWQHHVSLESHWWCPESYPCLALEWPSEGKSHSHLHKSDKHITIGHPKLPSNQI